MPPITSTTRSTSSRVTRPAASVVNRARVDVERHGAGRAGGRRCRPARAARRPGRPGRRPAREQPRDLAADDAAPEQGDPDRLHAVLLSPSEVPDTSCLDTGPVPRAIRLSMRQGRGRHAVPGGLGAMGLRLQCDRRSGGQRTPAGSTECRAPTTRLEQRLLRRGAFPATDGDIRVKPRCSPVTTRDSTATVDSSPENGPERSDDPSGTMVALGLTGSQRRNPRSHDSWWGESAWLESPVRASRQCPGQGSPR